MAMDWHRLFGISIADAVSGLPFEVLQELELARHEQRLDLAVVLLDGELPVTRPYWPDLPDGLTDLSAVNLFTYKSLRQPMSIPTLWELVGHFVDYAKERFADAWESKLQPPLEEFRLFAIATRRPFWLQPDERADQTSVLDGIYDLTGFDLPVRLIVPREVDLVPRNSIWHLLSGDVERVRYGMRHYETQHPQLYNFRNDLKDFYQFEGVEMVYTVDDYERESRERVPYEVRMALMKTLSPADRLKDLSPEDWLKDMSPEDRRALMKTLPPEDRLKDLSPADRLKDLPDDVIEQILQQRRSQAQKSSENVAIENDATTHDESSSD